MVEPHFVDSQYGYKLATYFVSAAKPSESVIIFLHGLRGGVHSSWMQAFFASTLKENNHLLAFEMIGHGNSGGTIECLHIGRAVDDLKTVLVHYQSQYPQIKRIKLAGGSLGGGVALRALASLPVERAFLRCPLVDFHHICTVVERVDMEKWQKDGKTYFNGPQVTLPWDMYTDSQVHQALKDLKDCQVPLLVCHGTADSIVDIEQSHQLGRIWGRDFSLLAVEGGDHSFTDPEHFDEMIRAGVEFLK